ncbi:MAG: prepilin-type N-terminal cleavage/methylation domain-containing protein [Synergistaceae bacterium]|jgi:type II secretory pathway pseudopilin PulG|nr:prepilin-type N-terminal cleavage/methylation domain-containing protein [Synergistaceae bacterium]
MNIFKPGFSLVEIMISMFILVVVLMSMMMTTIVTAGNVLVAKDAENARQLALEVMENCEQVKFDVNDAVYRSSIAANSKNITNGHIRAVAGIRRIAPHAAGELPISADIEVAVSWRSAFAGERTYRMNREVSVSAWQNAGDRSP